MAVDAGVPSSWPYNKWDWWTRNAAGTLEQGVRRGPRSRCSGRRGVNNSREDRPARRPVWIPHWTPRWRPGHPGSPPPVERSACEVVAAHHHTRVRGGRQRRGSSSAPSVVALGRPRFVLFTTGFRRRATVRFLERRLREAFGLWASDRGVGVRPPGTAAAAESPGQRGGGRTTVWVGWCRYDPSRRLPPAPGQWRRLGSALDWGSGFVGSNPAVPTL